MITAAEAHKKSDSMENERLQNMRKEIETAIRKAIDDGKYEVNIYKEIPKKILDELTALGYVIDRSSCAAFGEVDYNIQW